MLTTQPTSNGHITVDLGAPSLAPRRRPVNLSPWVNCPVPGWEGLRVRFVVSRSKAEIDGTDGDVARQAALLVGALDGWDFVEDVEVPGDPADPASAPVWVTRPIPPPRANDAASFDPCGVDLLAWFCQDGYRAGLQAAISPN